jgi:hypothetical protein
MTTDWGAVSAIGTILGSALVAGSLVYAAEQVREAKVARALSLLVEFHDRYNEEEVRIVRERLLNGKIASLDQLTEAERVRLSRTTDTLEFLAILVERKLVPFDLVFNVFPYSPPLVWARMNEYTAPSWIDRSHVPEIYLSKLVARYPRRGLP